MIEISQRNELERYNASNLEIINIHFLADYKTGAVLIHYHGVVSHLVLEVTMVIVLNTISWGGGVSPCLRGDHGSSIECIPW